MTVDAVLLDAVIRRTVQVQIDAGNHQLSDVTSI